jgi:mannose-1-phosphate guanylyltransferase/mannose-6-phosphate isomerase
MNIKNDQRPWGQFRQFTENENSTIKLISVESGQSLSLQSHQKRSEFWVVLLGDPLVTVGAEIQKAKAGDEFFIPQKTVHRLEAQTEKVEILEIAFGDFEESDILRIEDAYGRKL